MNEAFPYRDESVVKILVELFKKYNFEKDKCKRYFNYLFPIKIDYLHIIYKWYEEEFNQEIDLENKTLFEYMYSIYKNINSVGYNEDMNMIEIMDIFSDNNLFKIVGALLNDNIDLNKFNKLNNEGKIDEETSGGKFIYRMVRISDKILLNSN